MEQLIDVLDEVRPGTAGEKRRFYQPELDGLRFYAFLGVFVCHSLPLDAAFYHSLHLPMPWLWGAVAVSGASGVDLFFALSAFLITSLLLRERQETGGLSLRLFYIRRILRIWPLYFLVIAMGVVLAHTAQDSKSSLVLRSKSSLVLRCRLPSLRRQLGLRCLSERRIRSVLRCGRSRSKSSSTWFGPR